jgi:superfamily I DNA and RNA helicase
MSNSFFFLQADRNAKNTDFISRIEKYCTDNKQQSYLINKPLGDNKYSYHHTQAIVLLMPKHKIAFIDFSDSPSSFETFVDDFIEDLGSISDKFRYKDYIGRPKNWTDLIHHQKYDSSFSAEYLVESLKIQDPKKQRVCELLISLLTGSVNNIDKVKAEVPESLLDKIKQKILLFDGEQTRFVYEAVTKSTIRIQGLSGTGKTELLLHKLKELYVDTPDAKIVLTCHNKILADSLRKRIPDFFNFMKVEQQILWYERLWCMHAWGSYSNLHSGTYRYVCDHYSLPYESYSFIKTFDGVCKRAIQAIKTKPEIEKPFDYMLIDESQDFPESFFELCQLVTKSTVYIAGDIFQSIFDDTLKKSIDSDYLLNKCYRTDPRTLMFAHALGMGLFETKKLRWLDDQEWDSCGYIIEKTLNPERYHLKREPLRRFEDIDKDTFKSVEIVKIKNPFHANAAEEITSIINKIKLENPTADAEDIGVILLDSGNDAYVLADELEVLIPRNLGWEVNKAYETKSRIKNKLFVSNKNNVKGLEFPFVIVVANNIHDSYSYRNALYMTLTRSFLQTYLVISDTYSKEKMTLIESGLDKINKQGFIEVTPPSESEKLAIKTTIKQLQENVSFFDFMTKIFDELEVLPIFRDDLLDTVKKVVGEDFDRVNVAEIVEFNYKKMMRAKE